MMSTETSKANATPGTYKGKTPDQWRAAAEQSYRNADESFERSDTDGFLSQWASGCLAAEYLASARLAEQDGLIEVQALFNLDGTIASTHCGYNEQYRRDYWVLNDDAAARYGRRFYNPSGAKKAATRNANDRKKGFTVGKIRVAGYVTLAGEVTVHAVTRPVVDDLRSGAYDIIAAEDDTVDY